MSSTVLKIIPSIPNYVPGDLQQQRAKELLSQWFRPDQTELLNAETIEFVDQGENFESISCNLCDKILLLEEWHEHMDAAYETQFRDLNIKTSCQHLTSLNDLNYKWPAGFAKFIVRIEDPEHDLDDSDLNRLQEILETDIKIIWARY